MKCSVYLGPDMRNFLLSVVVVAVYCSRLATGRATISDNGYDNLVVAISPDVTSHYPNSDIILSQRQLSRFLRTPRL